MVLACFRLPKFDESFFCAGLVASVGSIFFGIHPFGYWKDFSTNYLPDSIRRLRR